MTAERGRVTTVSSMLARLALVGALVAALAACGGGSDEASTEASTDATISATTVEAAAPTTTVEYADLEPTTAADQQYYDEHIAPHQEIVKGQTYDVDRRDMLASVQFVFDSSTTAEQQAACKQHDTLQAAGNEENLRTFVEVAFSDQVDDLWGPAYTDVTLWMLRQSCY